VGTLASALRPIVADMVEGPRVYADANIPAGVVSAMRRELGWDVLFVLEEDGLRRATDREHYRLALEFGRTLITLDRDFCDDDRFPLADSPGVIICSAPDEAWLLTLLRRASETLLSAGELPLRGRKVELVPQGTRGPKP